MDFSHILNHPDVDEIVSKLLTGTSPKSVVDWLQLKYSKDEQSHLHISSKLLSSFQDSPYLDYYQQVEKDISKTKNGTKLDKKIADSLSNNKTYRDRLNEVLDKKIDANQAFQRLQILFETRMEQIFDKIQEDPGNIRKDVEGSLIKYMEQYMSFVEKHEKIINNRPDQVIQHNHVITYFDQYTLLMQDAIRETLMEIDPDAAFLFMEKLSERTANLKPPSFDDVSPQKVESKLLNEAKSLEDKLLMSEV